MVITFLDNEGNVLEVAGFFFFFFIVGRSSLFFIRVSIDLEGSPPDFSGGHSGIFGKIRVPLSVFFAEMNLVESC